MPHDALLPDDTLEIAERIAREAAALLLEHVRRGFAVEEKTPDDPVTIADREASELIVARLRKAFPQDGILSEELADSSDRLTRERVWIVDPIDGTREFVKGTGDYAVSIGLVIRGEPVLGVVAAPARDDVYAGVVGRGVWLNGKVAAFSSRALDAARIAVSDTEFERELRRFGVPGMVPSGSIAYKLARVAAGEADATFTINPRSEWDIAAGHALVRAAGGEFTTRDGGRITYNRELPRLRRGVIGGRPDVVAWLARELEDRRVPEQQQYVRPTDAVWSLLPATDASRLVGHGHVHARHGGGRIEALVCVRRATLGWEIERAEGDPESVRILVSDLQREYGRLSLPGEPDGAADASA